MAASLPRNMASANTVTNLYCAQCESQLGIFDNEWIRLTTSYARSKEKGTHFGTEVGHRTQVVPSGPAQRLAEGCVMAEVFCRKCSNMVGQYCKSAPDMEKQPLVDQYFYKLSRTYLKDSRTMAAVEPIFGYGSDMIKPAVSRSSVIPRSTTAPISRWANTPLRQSSSTPASLDLKRRESHGSPSVLTEPIEDRWEQSFAEIKKMRDEMRLQSSELQEQSMKLSSQTKRLDEQSMRLNEHNVALEEHESCQSAQAARIVEQDVIITEQTKCLGEQQSQLSAITTQLIKLQKTMDDLKAILDDPKRGLSSKQIVSQAHRARNSKDTDAAEATLRSAQSNAKELEALRAENESMKSKLNTIANAMGVAVSISSSEDAPPQGMSSNTNQAMQVLGKRKRNKASGGLSVSLGNTNTSFQTNTDQMPTPQSSDGGHRSPEQTPSITNCRGDDNWRPGQPNIHTELANGEELATVPNDFVHATLAIDATSGQGIVEQHNSIVRGQPVGERDGAPVATIKRRQGRRTKSQNAGEVADTNDELLIHPSPQTEARRVTRSSAKAVVPNIVPSADADPTAVNLEPVEPGATTSAALETSDVAFLAIGPDHSELNHITYNETGLRAGSSPVFDLGTFDLINASVIDPDLMDTSLPTVQVASSILGMDLEALIASSQALRQSLASPEVAMDDATIDPLLRTSAAGVVDGQPYFATTFTAQREESSAHPQINTMLMNNDSQQIQFVEDPAVYDPIDSSDDDDDLMQPDAALYGDDSLMDTSIVRQDRSMAPEPIQRQRPVAAPTYAINLDTRMHIATPEMFAKAYAAGRRPRLTRPGGLPTRERILNEELRQLGLTEWIGKQKNTKEYRDAVTAARARSRNYKKAAFLKNLGLNHNPAEPASTLPERPISLQPTPLTEVENVLSQAQEESNVATHVSKSTNEAQSLTKEQPRATRARTRRTSTPLVAGLENVEAQPRDVNAKSTPGRRKAEGRRKSQRRSAMSLIEQEVYDAFELLDDTQTAASEVELPNEQANTGSVQKSTRTKSGPGRRKTLGKTKIPPRDITASEPPQSMPNGEPIHTVGSVHAARASTQAPVAADVLIRSGDAGSNKGNAPLSPASQAKQREEAIMLRDRLAKQLMESEDVDM